jgi:hypothetical protein
LFEDFCWQWGKRDVVSSQLHEATPTNQPTNKMTINYQNRFTAALRYWLAQGEELSSARDLAHEQIEFEDHQALGEQDAWLGSNDSFPISL